jgi:hypothetical protein
VVEKSVMGLARARWTLKTALRRLPLVLHRTSLLVLHRSLHVRLRLQRRPHGQTIALLTWMMIFRSDQYIFSFC